MTDNTPMKLNKILVKSIWLSLLLCLSLPSWASTWNNLILASPTDPLGQRLYDQHRWSLLYYYGQTVNGALLGIPVGNFKHWPEHIQSLEVDYTLHEDNFFRQLVSPLVGVVALAGNGTIRQGENQHVIYEFDPYLSFRWANWAWNHKVTTSFAIGEGISYVSSIPAIERRGTNNNNLRRILNYLMLEATLAPPSYPQLQFVIRIHHRSGAFGLYQASNSGSNDIGAGIRYLF